MYAQVGCAHGPMPNLITEEGFRNGQEGNYASQELHVRVLDYIYFNYEDIISKYLATLKGFILLMMN